MRSSFLRSHSELLQQPTPGGSCTSGWPIHAASSAGSPYSPDMAPSTEVHSGVLQYIHQPKTFTTRNVHQVVIILAGYSKEMATFLSSNSGLTSRFPNVFAFADYTMAEMAKVARIGPFSSHGPIGDMPASAKTCHGQGMRSIAGCCSAPRYHASCMMQIVVEVTHSKGFSLADSLSGDRLESLVSRLIKPIDIPKGNGRLARNLVERAISRQTDRIFEVIKTAGTVAQVNLPTVQATDTAVHASACGTWCRKAQRSISDERPRTLDRVH